MKPPAFSMRPKPKDNPQSLCKLFAPLSGGIQHHRMTSPRRNGASKSKHCSETSDTPSLKAYYATPTAYYHKLITAKVDHPPLTTVEKLVSATHSKSLTNKLKHTKTQAEKLDSCFKTLYLKKKDKDGEDIVGLEFPLPPCGHQLLANETWLSDVVLRRLAGRAYMSDAFVR